MKDFNLTEAKSSVYIVKYRNGEKVLDWYYSINSNPAVCIVSWDLSGHLYIHNISGLVKAGREHPNDLCLEKKKTFIKVGGLKIKLSDITEEEKNEILKTLKQ